MAEQEMTDLVRAYTAVGLWETVSLFGLLLLGSFLVGMGAFDIVLGPILWPLPADLGLDYIAQRRTLWRRFQHGERVTAIPALVRASWWSPWCCFPGASRMPMAIWIGRQGN